MSREKQRAADKRWRLNHLEEERARDRERYSQNREAELARNKAYYPGYYEKNKETIKAKRRNGRHKITQEWFDSKQTEQHNRCAICLQPFVETPHVDHNHECCGEGTSCDKCRRGLLCEDCNLGLGRFKDNVVALSNAILYLNSYRKELQ